MLSIPETLAALAFFGGFFIVPLVYMLTKHQRAMAELMHRGAPDDAMRRIEMLEQEVRALKIANYEQIVRQDDERELQRRTGQQP